MNVTNSDINNFVDTIETIKTECEECLTDCMEYQRQTSDLKDDFEMTALTQEEIEELKEEIQTLHENTKLKHFWANCFLSVSIFVMIINCVLLVVS